MNTFSRRDFLHSSALLTGTTGLLSTVGHLRMASNAYSQTGGNYKALVCVFLEGGNDSFNMLVPTTSGEYSSYASVRSNMALPTTGSGAVLPISPSNTGGRTFGVHPSLPFLRDRFNSGDLSFVANIGPLVRPTTMAQFQGGNHPVPKALFSHNDQQGHWQSSTPQKTSPTGWGGRSADLLRSMNASSLVSMNISLDGTNLFQTGEDVTTYAITPEGSLGLQNWNSTANYWGSRNSAVSAIAGESYGNELRAAYAESTKEALDTNAVFSGAFDNATTTHSFPNSSIGEQLEAVAKIIQKRSTLGAERQVFFVTHGSYDTHSELLQSQSDLFGELNGALSAFWEELGSMGVRDEVLTFECSDFARTLRSNGLGTDHAWGGNVFAMGGAVDGGKIAGDYPTQLSLGAGLDVGTNGRLLPTTSCDEYFCECLQWFGITPGQMADVLPNIGEFYNPFSSSAPLGIIS